MKRAKPRKTARSEFPVNISHPDKVFWPDDGYTKGDLAKYYQEIFPELEPYVDDRILSMERCPDGMLGSCFYQKEMPKGMPAGTPSKRIKHVGKSTEYTNYVVGGSLATQLALVNLGCIAVHVAGTRASSERKPDWVCFDLDPQSGKFSDSAQAAVVMKEALDTLKLTSYAKTSGSRGVHIFIPIRLGPDADGIVFRTGCCGESRGGASKRFNCRAFHRSARPTRLFGSISKRVWPNGGCTLFRSTAAPGAIFDALGVVRTEAFARSRGFQSRQLPKTIKTRQSLERFFQGSPISEDRDSASKGLVAKPSVWYLRAGRFCRSLQNPIDRPFHEFKVTSLT
jgi:DNA ligase D-like protein (predicted polymerase)